MLKFAQPNSSELKANEEKRQTDLKAFKLIGPERGIALKKIAQEIIEAIGNRKPRLRIVLCGGAGSGKSTLAQELERKLKIPSFDLDDYIPGGHTPDKREYDKRLRTALKDLKPDLPDSWIVEHVEAANPLLLSTLKPDLAILLHTSERWARLAAMARSKVSGTDSGSRLHRALESRHRAASLFGGLKSEPIASGDVWTMKVVPSEFKKLLPSFSDELIKISAPSFQAKVERHFQDPNWAQFEKNLKAKGFQKEVLKSPFADDKLKTYTKNVGDYLTTKKVVGRVQSRTSPKVYEVKKLPTGRLACGCKDWQYYHSVRDSDCAHIRTLKAKQPGKL